MNSKIVKPTARRKMKHWTAMKLILENFEGISSIDKTYSYKVFTNYLADFMRSFSLSDSCFVFAGMICSSSPVLRLLYMFLGLKTYIYRCSLSL